MKKIILLGLILIHSHLFSQCFPDRHSTNWFDAWISCNEKSSPNPTNAVGHWILFDLKHQYAIDKIKIWNVNDPDHLDRGMKDVRLEYSLDSILWSSAGDFTLQKAEGTNRYEGMDWFDVNIPKTQYILVTALSNFGGKCTGLAEIRFSGEKIEIVTDVGDEHHEYLFIKILPNPFNEIFRAELHGSPGSIVDIRISDLFGKTIHAERIPLENGYNALQLQTRKWAAGAYVLTANMGANVYRQSLIKL